MTFIAITVLKVIQTLKKQSEVLFFLLFFFELSIVSNKGSEDEINLIMNAVGLVNHEIKRANVLCKFSIVNTSMNI